MVLRQYGENNYIPALHHIQNQFKVDERHKHKKQN